MRTVAIVGNGPRDLIPDLAAFNESVDVWIGADRGALTLAETAIRLDYAVGDFDSMTAGEKEIVQGKANVFRMYPSEKDQTDLEIALEQAYELAPKTIYIFGVTGGRLDHELINVQLLHRIMDQGIQGVIIDRQNRLELVEPGRYEVRHDNQYPTISFVPFTSCVEGLTLEGFYYPLTDASVAWGSTLCISNKLISNYGTFSYHKGILLIIKNNDQ
ncbi:thiamine diphosphokinase [Lentibacillus juripiscarius]|uniref:Thiamine diphosphokinase n=2 Tax=Lentibacillus juripiscarius TaxID=257446 RepID=A0ABW5V7A2_9BACI